jgi:hypothetical protein
MREATPVRRRGWLHPGSPMTQQRLAESKNEIAQCMSEISRRKRRITEDQIRARWQQHGCPPGRDKEFWH